MAQMRSASNIPPKNAKTTSIWHSHFSVQSDTVVVGHGNVGETVVVFIVVVLIVIVVFIVVVKVATSEALEDFDPIVLGWFHEFLGEFCVIDKQQGAGAS